MWVGNIISRVMLWTPSVNVSATADDSRSAQCMHSDQDAYNKNTTKIKKKSNYKETKNKDLCVQSEQHKVRGQLSIICILLTSILLSSDPALLRLPRLPAQNM